MMRWFLFLWDAERIHRWVSFWISFFGRTKSGRSVLRVISKTSHPEQTRTQVWGMSFLSPVGLAAGFDKNGKLLPSLMDLGFGFAEIGTVTPRAQSGNEKPRLFREPQEKNLFNRMGFNNEGSVQVAKRLRQFRESGTGHPAFRVGVNVGKNKETPLEEAPSDYANGVRPFEGLADYFVINVSSPNTPGLRSLQNIESLKKILGAVQKEIQGWRRHPPLLLKLSPELCGKELFSLLSWGERSGIQGWVLTNTLAGNRKNLPGGRSGSILSSLSLDRLKEARSKTSLPIISVGGVMGVKEAQERIRSGAQLVQVFTGWVYGGVAFPGEITRGLTAPIDGEKQAKKKP